jgi:hypothetical protein
MQIYYHKIYYYQKLYSLGLVFVIVEAGANVRE